MDMTGAAKVTVVQPGAGESVSIPGFGCVYKLYNRDNGGEVAIVEHPFDVGFISAPHRHTREDDDDEARVVNQDTVSSYLHPEWSDWVKDMIDCRPSAFQDEG